MTKQEIKWFDELHDKRTKQSEFLRDPEFVNVFNDAIDKYSESAHFLYELFQNADDAGATKADLILETYIPASIHNEAMLSGAWTSIAQ